MKANLSLVLDKDGYVRLDLLKELELSEIDKYTTTYSTSKEIKEEYQDDIDCFLEEQLDFIQKLKREQDKRGRIVIVYEDEKHKLHQLRVLYKENIKKIDVEKMINNIKKTLETEESFYKTLDVINHFSSFIFGSEFDRKEIGRLKKRLSSGNVSEKLCNKNLIKNIIYNHLVLTLSRNKEKAYFHVRLIDSYMEKNGLFTTKEKSKNIKKLNVSSAPSKTKIKKQSPYIRVQEGGFFMEENGQYNLFDSSQPALPSKQRVFSYEEYEEDEEERRLNI